MTVVTPLATRPSAPTPPVTRYTAPTHVSLPHVVSHAGQANGTFASSSTPLPNTSTHVSHPHIVSYLEQANGSSSASATPLSSRSTSPSYVPTATSLRFHDASHEPHPRIGPRSIQSRTPLAPSPTLPISHSTPHISSAPLPSRSTAHPTSPFSSPPRQKRSRRCFVCGGTGKHRLNPCFCPRTYELLSKHLATFDATFRLVSFDGSPLPMTRHPGGVAAHLLSPRRFLPRTAHASSRSVSKPPGGSHANPPHVPHAPHNPPICVNRRIPDAVPIANLNRPHPSHSPVEPPLRISSLDHPTSNSNPPHVAVAATVRPHTVNPSVDLNSPHASHSSAVLPHPISGLDRRIESGLPHLPPATRWIGQMLVMRFRLHLVFGRFSFAFLTGWLICCHLLLDLLVTHPSFAFSYLRFISVSILCSHLLYGHPPPSLL